MHEVFKLTASGLLAYSVHYGSEKFYNTICTADGVSGFIQGLFTVASPWCTLALSTMTHTQSLYSNFVVFGVSRLLVEFVSPASKQPEAQAGTGST